MRVRVLLFAVLFSAITAQTVDFTTWPDSVSDMAFSVDLAYSGFEALWDKDFGMIVSLNTELGDYLSDGKLSLGTSASGTATVIITPPLGFIENNIGLNVSLRAFVIKYTDILRNVSTAYSYALKDQNLTGIIVTEREAYGSAGKLRMVGVNIGGGENGAKYDSASALYFKEQGFNTFGLFTSWSRLIPNIATGSMKLSEATALTEAVNYITKKVGGFCVLELHDYGRFKGDALGKGLATYTRFASVWSKLADMFSNNSRVIFSLMNEPHDQDSADYVTGLQAAVTAIRTTGATNWIMIQGNRWNSAMNWLNVDEWGKANTEVMPTVKDPNGKIMFNIHQYLDATHGGSFDGCISNNIGALYLSGVTQWLRNNNAHAYLGEFGSSNDTTCKGAVDDVLKFLAANSDVWVGWSWWNAGAYLADTSYSVQPMENEDGTLVANDKLKWLSSHFDVKCPVTYSSAQVDSKNWACANLLNGVEGAIATDAEETEPTDGPTTGTKKPGKVVSLKPNSASNMGISVMSSTVAVLLVLAAFM